MKKPSITLLLWVGACTLMAQLPLPPNGDNQLSEVVQYMGLVRIHLTYHSPDVDGRDIWGNVVPYGMTNFGVAKSSQENPSPWRGGANENTTITFSHDIVVESTPLKAGTYGLHFVPGQQDWVVIFSYNSTAWGSFFYTPTEDALRVTVKPITAEFNEWLSYTFSDRRQNSCTLQLKWENLTIPVRISAPNGNDLYIQKIRQEAQGAQGSQGAQFFDWLQWVQAANFCATRKINLEEAMGWLQIYLGRGIKTFPLLEAESNILLAMGKTIESDAIMKEAVTLTDATANQLTNYGRRLLAENRVKEAMLIFQDNAKRHPGRSAALMGLARGYSASGDFDRALRYAQDALKVETNTILRTSIEASIKMLQNRKVLN